MIKLKHVVHYPDTNSVEATWADVEQLPDIEIAEVPASYDEEGTELTAAIPAHTEPGGTKETVIKCHSYADVQMDMFLADIASIAGDANEHAALIALVQAGIKPHVPEPVVIPDVSPRQIRQALTRAKLRTNVENAVMNKDQDLQDWWGYSTVFSRYHPEVVTMIAALGITEAEADALWLLAGTL